MKINMFNFFKRKKTFQYSFAISSFTPLKIVGALYPLFLSLAGKGLPAYYFRFMVEFSDLLKVEDLIAKRFKIKNVKENECLYNLGNALHYYKFKDLNFIAIDIITNDNNFIADLNSIRLEPPSPDKVFPHLILDSYGSLQGELAFWWDIYWEPFWNSLTEEDHNKYIERKKLSNEVVLFLRHHQK